jgi:peptidoglycan/xylan/chitin deacetylase (PgdA/CDA1 family)
MKGKTQKNRYVKILRNEGKEEMKKGVIISAIVVVFLSGTLYLDQQNRAPQAKAKDKVEQMGEESGYKDVAFSSPTSTNKPEVVKTPLTVSYTGSIEQLLVRSIIVDEDKAFSKKDNFKNVALTAHELEGVLGSLYKKGYVLVSMEDVIDDKTYKQKSIALPKGKKPLLLTIEDTHYNKYKESHGVAKRFEPGRDKESAIGILNSFIKSHPDFTWQGARGIVSLSSKDSILGYDLQKNEEVAQLKTILSALKREGWELASGSHSRSDVSKMTLSELKKDTENWKKVMNPLIGDTAIYVYPSGSELSVKSEKYEYLVSAGFHFFLSEGKTSRLVGAANGVTMERRHIDGSSLTTQAKSFTDLFNASEIVDANRKG